MGIVKNFDTLFDRLETNPMPNFLFGLIVLFFSPGTLYASEIMFEGYYRIEVSGEHIGYAIQRYEYDSKAKGFTCTTFMRVKMGDKVIQESLKAKSNDKFQPLSYQYTSQVNETTKGIDATFKGQIMTLKRFEGGSNKVKNETYKIPEGSFLSSFLMFVMLQKKLALNQAFKYSGIAEEEGASYWGKAWLESKEVKGKQVHFRVFNMFKDEEFISRMVAIPDPAEADKYLKAEFQGTESPKQKLTTRLIATPNQATEGQTVPNKTLIGLFGAMPTGKVNLIASPPTEK